MFKRILCRSASRPETSMDRHPGSGRSARKLPWLVLAAALPAGVFLNGQLSGDELKPIPQLQAKPTFKPSDEKVEPIRATVPDTGVTLLSHQEELPSRIEHASAQRPAERQKVQLLQRRRQSRDRDTATPLPRLDSLISTTRQKANVEDLVQDVTDRDQFLNELRHSVNPVQHLPLPESVVVPVPSIEEPAELRVEAKPVDVPPAMEFVEKLAPRPEPIPERKIIEVIRVQSEPNWVVMNAKPKFNQPALGLEEVGRLITRARMELAAGDLEMAHLFAEAAAEVNIPLAVFEKRPELILSEIEYVTARQQAVVRVDYDAFAEGGAPSPNSPTQRLKKDPRGFRALGKTALNARPKTVDPDGGAQQLPEPETQRQLALLPDIVQQPGFGRGWNPVSYAWEAPALYHSPLYFEEVEPERYGNEYCGLQPVVSGVRFFLTPFVLPYQMGIEENGPFSCHYDLGHNRPGECVPFSIHALPFSWTGALAEGAVATGLAFLIP